MHVFSEGKDVRDNADLRLVVLGPEYCHKRKDMGSKAIAAAEGILTSHGDKPREFQNRLLFLALDVSAIATLKDQVRRYLAWKSIVDEADELNLDKHHEKEAKKQLEEATRRVDGSIKETYRFVLAPMQDPDAPGGLTTILWEDEALSLAGSSFERAIETVTRDREFRTAEFEEE